MKTLITQAIEERQRLRAILEGRRRITVEPYALGITAAGRDALLCRQVAPPALPGADWQLYCLDQLTALQTVEERFDFPTSARHQLVGHLAEITAMV